MLRYDRVGNKMSFGPYKRFTMKPAFESYEKDEAHFQTLRGQLLAMGKEAPPNKPEDTERIEYANS